MQVRVLWPGDHYTSLVFISVLAPTSCPGTAYNQRRVLHLELRTNHRPLRAAAAARAACFCGYQLLAHLLHEKRRCPGDLGTVWVTSAEGWGMTAREISANSVAIREGSGWAERGMSPPGTERGCHSGPPRHRALPALPAPPPSPGKG